MTETPAPEFADRHARLREAVVGRSLLGRFSRLTALLVALSAIVLSLSSYFVARYSLEHELDLELLSVANTTADSISNDMRGMGGLNNSALSTSDVVLVLLRADKGQSTVPNEQVSFQISDADLAIARTQMGYSARTTLASDGQEYRVVAVPLQIDSTRYAVVLARSMGPMLATLRQLRELFLGASLAFIAAAAVVGYQSGRRVVQPLQELSTAVKRITETDQLVPVGHHSGSEVGELARSFDSMMDSLRTSRERQKRLIADAGHELRTPLTSMRTNVELLVADENTGMLPPGARQEILADVAAQLGEFTSLVGDLVQLSRDEVVTRSPEPLNFADVIRNAVARAQRRGHWLTFDVQLEPYFVVGDSQALERAVTNLLDNAVKFSPQDGTVFVGLRDGVLTVADQGPGISDEDLPKIFDRFYRSDKARNTPGTGLGLSMVDHTITAHGGTVTAANTAIGHGAVFTVTLPPAPDEALATLDEDE
ncbi:MAG: HAMP domain-containing histidine kinase [Propionibacteriaceae bacterium]|nr:HAMP domain-containing histidine kinase [Propionibacteriaceae bacterium]